jgi:hypothetical protein
MDDACRYAFAKLKQLIIGGDTKSGRALEELNKVTTKIYRISKQQSHPGAKLDEDQLEKMMTHRATPKNITWNTLKTLKPAKSWKISLNTNPRKY